MTDDIQREETVINSFSETYEEARRKFVAEATHAGGALERIANPERGPDGHTLSTDIARFGPASAEKLLVMISGTHGVEGFYGSGVQVEWLVRGGASNLPKDTAALLIHAINPYGFAWQRRVDENNVDLNRNWLDFSRPLPVNKGYAELADVLCPTDWSPESQHSTGVEIGAWVARNGVATLQQAVTGGQWHYPHGIFYGGSEPVWARRTLTDVLTRQAHEAGRVLLLDFHTGLGAYGVAELIIHRRPDDEAFTRTQAWVGKGSTSYLGGNSVASEISGDGFSAIPSLLCRATVDAVTLECGIRAIDEVGTALRADAWLHRYGDPLSPQGRAIKSQIRAAFDDPSAEWRGMAAGQALAAIRAALGELSQI